MCSDGQVSKDNALRGHSHWKSFVNEQYLKVHDTAPYVETIGISPDHDADVLAKLSSENSFPTQLTCVYQTADSS